ncbi:hypothetical protein EJB05_22800, partial [Eragrostis curvula]
MVSRAAATPSHGWRRREGRWVLKGRCPGDGGGTTRRGSAQARCRRAKGEGGVQEAPCALEGAAASSVVGQPGPGAVQPYVVRFGCASSGTSPVCGAPAEDIPLPPPSDPFMVHATTEDEVGDQHAEPSTRRMCRAPTEEAAPLLPSSAASDPWRLDPGPFTMMSSWSGNAWRRRLAARSQCHGGISRCHKWTEAPMQQRRQGPRSAAGKLCCLTTHQINAHGLNQGKVWKKRDRTTIAVLGRARTPLATVYSLGNSLGPAGCVPPYHGVPAGLFIGTAGGHAS